MTNIILFYNERCYFMWWKGSRLWSLNYRVTDRVGCNPDKSKLKETFLDYIEKSAFYTFNLYLLIIIP